MKPVFLDTSFLIALESADDINHSFAAETWAKLKSSLPPLLTTTYILNEIVTFFNSRNRHSKAVEVGNLLIESPSVQLVHVDEVLFYEAWSYFTQHRDKSYSLADCISFVLMTRLGVPKSTA
jgi:predicted nucleic acid-binding protein